MEASTSCRAEPAKPEAASTLGSAAPPPMGAAELGRKKSVRQRVQLPGWQVPPGNLLQRYLEACERQGAVAVTGVSSQLLRRVRGMQALPYHRALGQDRQQLLDMLVQHMDPGGTQQVPAHWAELAIVTLNPRLPWRESLALGAPDVAAEYARVEAARAELREKDVVEFVKQRNYQLSPVSMDAFAAAAAAASQGLPDSEVAQAVLECLAVPGSGVSAADPALLFLTLFRHLDVSSEGFVAVQDLAIVALHLYPSGTLPQLVDAARAAAEGQLEGTGAHLLVGQLCKRRHETVREDEFVSCLLEGLVPLSGLTMRRVESVVLELLSRRIRPLHSYDFSRDYLGVVGLPPLLEALAADRMFVALNLSGTGVTDSTCELLFEWLKDHPSITSLDLSHNPIGDSGGVVLAALLDTNQRIVDLNIQGTHFMRRFSRDHHNNLGPSACEDGHPILAGLLRNHAHRARQPRELVQMLRSSGPELKALFAALGDLESAGLKVPLSVVCAEVKEIAEAWGFDRAAVDVILLSERLLGAGGKVPDDSGTLHIRFEEFMQFLEMEDQTARVAYAIKHHRLAAKRTFYRVLDRHSRQQQQQQHEGASTGHGARKGGKETALQESVPEPSEAEVPSGKTLAAEPAPLMLAPLDGSGPNAPLSAVKEALIQLAMEPGSGWGVSKEDMETVLQPWLFSWPGGVGDAAAASHAHAEEDVCLSWPAFFNTAMHVLNR